MTEKNLALTRLMTATQGIDMGETALRPGSAQPEDKGSTFYPFFMSAVIAGLVPPFFEFFFAVLRHYKLHALHLHPNLFSFYRFLPSTERHTSG